MEKGPREAGADKAGEAMGVCHMSRARLIALLAVLLAIIIAAVVGGVVGSRG